MNDAFCSKISKVSQAEILTGHSVNNEFQNPSLSLNRPMIDLWPKLCEKEQVKDISVALEVHSHLCGGMNAHRIKINHSLDAIVIVNFLVIPNNLDLVFNAQLTLCKCCNLQGCSSHSLLC